ncbi:hypothetical protein P4H08_18935 [Bacillus cereus]|nr:hypothetical protein [Bacillus cereus]
MKFLEKFSSSLIGYYSRKFIYFHFVVFGIFGLGYELFLKNFQISRLDVYSFLTIVFTLSLMVIGMEYIVYGNSKWTFKRVIRTFFRGCIASTLVLGLANSWFFFQDVYKNGYYSLAFNIATIQAIVLYIVVSLADKILKHQNELKEFQRSIKKQFIN